MWRTTEAAVRRTLAQDGHTVDRPVIPGDGRTLPLAYVRTGPRAQRPIVFIPGGPGMGSIAPYPALRSAASRRGLDVIMVEHRGVGASRRDSTGADLPVGAVTVAAAADDIAAVLDHAGVAQAVIYGASYGSFLAQAMATRHPQRVASLVLDSPMLSIVDDLAMNRAHRRRLLWQGDEPSSAALAAGIRALNAHSEPMDSLSHVVQVVYEYAGPEVLHRLVAARRQGRHATVWRLIAQLGRKELEGGMPYVVEPDLVSGITYGEVGFGLPPDGEPLDPQTFFAKAAAAHPPFQAESFDFVAALPTLSCPITVVSGERDLRTPRPVATRIVDLAQRGVLVPLPGVGHSALDTHPSAALLIAAAAQAGTQERLPQRAAALSALPRRGASGALGGAISAVVRATTRAPTRP